MPPIDFGCLPLAGTCPALPLPADPPSNAAMAGRHNKPTALVASSAEAAQAAEVLLREKYQFVPQEEAEQVIALGGDGFLLQTLHEMLHRGKLCPIFGMNRGTVGFLMNEWRIEALRGRV